MVAWEPSVHQRQILLRDLDEAPQGGGIGHGEKLFVFLDYQAGGDFTVHYPAGDGTERRAKTALRRQL